MSKKKTTKPKLTEAQLRERYDFDHIREHFFDVEYDIDDVVKDIVEIYNDALDLSQFSAEGKNTVRVTNYFVRKTQLKATSIRSKMSPYNAIYNDDALCQILNRIQQSPRFFNIYNTVRENLVRQGYNELFAVDLDSIEDGLRKDMLIKQREEFTETLKKADLQEIRRALAHIPAFQRVSQFPNHVAQRIYEKYAPIDGGIILDSSCVDGDTEYFNGKGWKKIKDYVEGDYVLQYNQGHTSELVKPIRYIHYKDKDKPFYHFTSYNTDQMLTGDHSVISVDRVNGTSLLDYNTIYRTSVEEFIKSGYPLDRTRIPTTVGGILSNTDKKFELTEDELRFIIACQADASITLPYYTTSDKQHFVTNPVYDKGTRRIYKSYAKFSKQCKIDRFRLLLNNLNISYSTNIYKYESDKHNDQTVFEFIAPDFLYNVFNKDKDFPQEWIYTMTSDMRDVFLDEIFRWDGTKDSVYINTNKHNAEFVFTLLLTSDIMPKMYIEDRTDQTGKEHYKKCYYVSAGSTKSCSLFNKYPATLVYKEDKYCFTVPSGMLVLRRNGKPFITGNCGWGNRMMAAMSSKYHYKYIGTDPNSEMHNNYYALAETMWKTLYETNSLTSHKVFPRDYIDIRDQGSEFDIPEWHNNSGYDLEELRKRSEELTKQNKENTRSFHEAHGFIHPVEETGKGVCDTGDLNTTGLKLPPIMRTHDEDIYYSGICDLSFTSPPYFALECYTEDSFKGNLSDGQSAGKGDSYPRWVKEFMYPTIINHFNYLKPGGYYAYNLKDLPKDKMYLYSDWLSACIDVGFELIEQPEMILKSRRQFGKKEDGMTDKIDFKGATEKIGVLRKPMKHNDIHIQPDNKDVIYHVQNNFNYPLISKTRPGGFTSRLPEQIENYLKEKYDGKRYNLMKKS